jgi:hypothetical protein
VGAADDVGAVAGFRRALGIDPRHVAGGVGGLRITQPRGILAVGQNGPRVAGGARLGLDIDGSVYRAVTGTEPDPFWEALNFSPEWATTSHRAAELDAYVGSLLARLR